jgi:hypothetical protein
MNGGDVRVIERGQDLRFAIKALPPLHIVGDELRQDLDRDVALQSAVAGAIHLAHAAGADGAQNFEPADARPAFERHDDILAAQSSSV